MFGCEANLIKKDGSIRDKEISYEDGFVKVECSPAKLVQIKTIMMKFVMNFGIFIPEVLQEEDSTSVDDFKKNKSILKLNPERNIIYWEAKDVNNGSYYMGPVEIRENNEVG